MKIDKIISGEDYIIDAYKNCNIIGIGEGDHHLENSHHFFQRIFDNKKIQETVDIVIVEFANAKQQDILDKYIFGEEIDLNELRKIWRESTQSINRFGEATIYFELLLKIRNVNFTLSSNKKIRVLGGDPPIDWTLINSLEDYLKINITRELFAADLAIEYGIKRSKKVLMIYAEYHLTKISDKSRKNMLTEINDKSIKDLPTITNYVNTKYPDTMQIIAVLNPKELQLSEKTKNWPLYSIVDLKEEEFGNLPAVNYFTQIFNNDGRMILFAGNKLKELFDAFLYIGQSETWKRVDYSRSIFSDNDWNELNRRRQMLGLESLDDSLK
jgi:hypothetical protein